MEQGGTWATVEEGNAFIHSLPSGQITSIQVGTSSDGRAIQLLRVGVSETPPEVLILSSQHGFEHAGREALLRLIRDAAESSLPFAFWAVHTPNPFGSDAGSRYNASGRDINRTHVSLETPEALAISRAIAYAKPLLLVDAHEWGENPADMAVKGSEPFGRPEIAVWANETIARMQEELPMSVIPYPATPHEGTITGALSANCRVPLLLESDFHAPPDDRVTYHLQCFRWILGLDLGPLRTAVASSEVNAQLDGHWGHERVNLFESGWTQMPYGYLVPACDVPWRQFESFNVRVVEPIDDEWVYVPLGQPAMYAVVWLLDPRAPRALVSSALPVLDGSEVPVDCSGIENASGFGDYRQAAFAGTLLFGS